jgi:hypothetical protein
VERKKEEKEMLVKGKTGVSSSRTETKMFVSARNAIFDSNKTEPLKQAPPETEFLNGTFSLGFWA